jgi:hypothetical protein
LKSLHEVVVRNRLEQLRKRQRDEALLAQEELLAGVAKSASRKWGTEAHAAIVEAESTEPEVVLTEEMEDYDRSMTPELLDITKLPVEERQIDILTEEEDRRALVSVSNISCFCLLPSDTTSSSNAVRLLLLDLYPKQPNRSRKLRIRRLPVVLISPPRPCIEQRPKKIWTKRKSCSI